VHWNEPAERAFECNRGVPTLPNAARHAVVFKGKRHDGPFCYDGGALNRIAPCAEAGGLALSALRSNHEPLSTKSCWTASSLVSGARKFGNGRLLTATSIRRTGRLWTQYFSIPRDLAGHGTSFTDFRLRTTLRKHFQTVTLTAAGGDLKTTLCDGGIATSAAF
jgi:hypothetical protein